MKFLSIDEYKKYRDEWSKKHFEYVEKLVQINKSETDYNEKESEKKRKQLKKEYKGYIDIYFDPNVYTDLNEDTLQKLDLYNDHNAVEIVKESDKKKGKKFKYALPKNNNTIYTFVGAIITFDDFYYIGIDENNKQHFFSCVGKLDFIE